MDPFNPIIVARRAQPDEELRWRDLPRRQKLAIVAVAVAILATGLVERDSLSVAQAAEEEGRVSLGGPCQKFNADAERLVTSMVQASYIAGADEPSECYYSYRSE